MYKYIITAAAHITHVTLNNRFSVRPKLEAAAQANGHVLLTCLVTLNGDENSDEAYKVCMVETIGVQLHPLGDQGNQQGPCAPLLLRMLANQE